MLGANRIWPLSLANPGMGVAIWIFGPLHRRGGQLLKRGFRSLLVVFETNSSWYVPEEHRDPGFFLGVGEAYGDYHLAAKCRVLGLETNDFRNLFVGDQLDNLHLESVGVRRRLAGRGSAQGPAR
jgi:hypothetical protein